MADYDFHTLSPLDFEQFVNDLVQAKYATKVQRFGPGKDGGIDGRFALFGGNAVVQAKHYRNSSFNQLKASLLRSKPQMEAIEPTKYIVCTSQSLSPQRKDELACALDSLPIDAGDIWACEDLNAMLREFPEVEKSNIKLWLTSAGVLDRLLNSETYNRTDAILRQIQKAAHVFVHHEGYDRAVEVIENQRILIVSGPPGVGKTTLALMVAAGYLNKEWEILAVNRIDEALKTFSSRKKQVFLFDDFLGSIKLDRDSLSKEDSDFRRFIELVRHDQVNTRFIMTTRKYILEEARMVSETFSDESLRLANVVVDLNLYTKPIKSRILYNHLYFSNLKEEFLSALVNSGKLKKIIEHRNYMPRIVEWSTSAFRLSDCSPDEYPEYFIGNLDKPDRIWKHAVEEHLEPSARLLLHALFFLPFVNGPDHTFISWFEDSLKILARKQNFSLREGEYDRGLRVLEGSFIEIRGRAIAFVNPSLRDYLSVSFMKSDALEALSKSVKTLQQALWIWKFIKQIPLGRNKIGCIYQGLLQRCVSPQVLLTAGISLSEFIEMLDDFSVQETDRRLFNIAMKSDSLDLLHVDLEDLLALFGKVEAGEIAFVRQEEMRAYLSARFTSALEASSLDLEEAASLLRVAEKYMKYINEEEHDALIAGAECAANNASLPSSVDGESEWNFFYDQLEIIGRWTSTREVVRLREAVEAQLGVFEEYRAWGNPDYDSEANVVSNKISFSARSNSLLTENKQSSQVNEVQYRDVFSSLLSPDGDGH